MFGVSNLLFKSIKLIKSDSKGFYIVIYIKTNQFQINDSSKNPEKKMHQGFRKIKMHNCSQYW